MSNILTKEERAEVRKAICENREALQVSRVGSWLKQYEDTVTELENKLKYAMESLNFTSNYLEVVDGCFCSECTEKKNVMQFISQLVKGDKDNEKL